MSATAPTAPIYAGGRDFYRPSFQVMLRGRPLGPEVVNDITQVTYKDNVDEFDGFDITINNWDAEKRSYKYVDRDLFDPGKELELSIGYYGDLKKVVTGEITSLKPNFPAAGQPTLAITGLNLLHRLRRKEISAAYEQKTDSQIAKEIANRLGFKIETPNEQDETVHPYLLQDNQFDIVFLLTRARQLGYELFVKEDTTDPTLFFGRSEKVRRTVYALTYGSSLIQFQPTLSTAKQVGKVTVRGWDAVAGKAITKTVERNAVTSDPDASEEMKRAFGTREEVIVDQPVRDEKEAQTLAEDTLSRMVGEMVKGSGSIVGLPDLRAGSVITIDGVGERFSGRFFVTATTHTIGDGGYTTEFECRREES